ncbi:hypothetical protein Dsin_004879 [Dipteronia sinensis]|uniref:KIB1-4 beta-propeller domain-containing protein n=1 Tax=Dipteronia sinensis TaxID=43782 RepID=A0AAE0AVU1_9ROSI|nr:hypothetical protein Dsin_004879 [Dipteronia sinensis]
MANWAALNHDLLVEIVWRITWYDDFVAFGGVCTSWRSAASILNFRSKSPQMPWLMLPSKVDRNLRGFFSVTKGATRQIILPKAYAKKCFSSRGFLITPGDNVWTTIDEWNGYYFDITYFNGKFYTINSKGTIMACDIKDDRSIETYTTAQLPNRIKLKDLHKLYILESAGKLLVVLRKGVYLHSMKEDESKSNYGTYAFQIFEVDICSNTCDEVKNLGKRALFLGDNSSLSIEVLDVTRCKSNCIYFTDDCRESYSAPCFCGGGGGKDMGIYNIQDESIEPYIRSNFCELVTPPLWVEQSF